MCLRRWSTVKTSPLATADAVDVTRRDDIADGVERMHQGKVKGRLVAVFGESFGDTLP